MDKCKSEKDEANLTKRYDGIFVYGLDYIKKHMNLEEEPAFKVNSKVFEHPVYAIKYRDYRIYYRFYKGVLYLLHMFYKASNEVPKKKKRVILKRSKEIQD